MSDIIPQDIPMKQCTGPCQRVLPATTDCFHKNRSRMHARCKECRNKASKPYNDARSEDRKRHYQEHGEEIRIRHNQYREMHREEINEQKRLHYKAHREEIRTKHLHYRIVHQEEINEQKRQAYRENRAKHLQHYQEHREEMLAKAARYRNAHREEIYKREKQSHQRHRALHLAHRRAYKQRRRARLRSIECTLSVQQIIGKLKAQNYACYYCFRMFLKRADGTYIYHLDHTVPISRTDFIPRNDANYVVLACPHCNQCKNDKLPHEWYEGGRLF